MQQETKNMALVCMFICILIVGFCIIISIQESRLLTTRQKLALVCLDNKKAKECQDEKVYSVR